MQTSEVALTGVGRHRLIQRLAGAGLSLEASEAILARQTLVRYPKGAQLFAPGSAADMLFVVLAGVVKLYCGARDRKVLITLAGPGDVIGYADFTDPRGGRAQLFEAVSLSSVSIALVTREHLLRVLRELDPAVLLALGERINSRWASALNRWVGFLAMSLRERLTNVLAELAERFGVPDSRGLLLPQGLFQEDIAEMIGGSRPMVSKLLLDLARQGLVIRCGRRYAVRPAITARPPRGRELNVPPPIARVALAPVHRADLP
jgi:CRP-like cAMP-binding protein